MIYGIGEHALLSVDYTSEWSVLQLCDYALFCGYLSRATKDGRFGRASVLYLNAVAARGVPFSHVGLHGGLAGYAWTVQHLLRIAETEDSTPGGEAATASQMHLLSQGDGALLDAIAGYSWGGTLDIPTGLAGIGVYFLERSPGAAASRGLELVVDRIAAASKTRDSRTAWYADFRPVKRLKPRQDSLEWCELGMLEGQLCIIRLLSDVYAAAIKRNDCSRLLSGAVQWLISLPASTGISRFGPVASSGYMPPYSRLAWSSGDLAVAIALLNVEQVQTEVPCHKYAWELLNRCLAWPADFSWVVDTSFFDGSAGVAHAFNRIYQWTGDAKCLNAAREWYEWSLSLGRQDFRSAGRPPRGLSDKGSLMYPDVQPIQRGSIGLALCLVSAVAPIPPAWDRSVLLSKDYRWQTTSIAVDFPGDAL